MLTLVFGMPVSKGKVNRSLDLCLIAIEQQEIVNTGLYLNIFIVNLSCFTWSGIMF